MPVFQNYNYYRILLLLICCSVAFIAASQKCHVGWSYLPSTGYCYGSSYGSTSSITWTDAENMCQSFGGHLAMPESLAEFRHILSYFHVSFRNTWVALWVDDLRYGKWTTIDGTSTDILQYLRWCTAHPWYQFTGKRCIGLGYDGGVCWFDQDCVTDNNMQALCKAPPLSIDGAAAKDYRLSPKYRCKYGWSYFPPTGYCYGSSFGSTTSTTWMGSETWCQSAGGHLVTPQSLAEFRHVLSYFHVSFRNTWYGVYSDSLANGHYLSIDGNPVDFSHSRWCLSHPWMHIPGRRCIGLGYDGTSVCYFDQNCDTDLSMQMLCKAKPELVPEIFEEPEANPPLPPVPAIQTVPTVSTTTTRQMSCLV